MPPRQIPIHAVALFVAILIHPLASAESQETVTLSGSVVDAGTGLPVDGANVRLHGTSVGTTTSSDGTFSLLVPEAETYDLRVSRLGYLERRLVPRENLSALRIDLTPSILIADEIVVTGKKIPRTLHDTRESVALIDRVELDRRAIRAMDDVYAQTANASTLGGEGFTIRGVSHNSSSTGGGTGDLGAHLVDGVSFTGFSKKFGPQDLWDVGQVEVMRGPQTTSVGRNALAGAVVVKTSDPELSNRSAWRLGIGSYGSVVGSGMVNVEGLDGQAFRFAVDHNRTDGYVTNPTRNNEDYDARENTTARAKWSFLRETNSDLKATLTVQVGRTDRGEKVVDLTDPGARQNTSNLENAERLTTWSASLDLGRDIGNVWRIRSQSSLLASTYDRLRDDDQGPGGGDAFRKGEGEDDNWTQEIRLDYRTLETHGVVGLVLSRTQQWEQTDGKINIDPALVGVPEPLLPFYPPLVGVGLDTFEKIRTLNFAAFTEWETDLSPTWKAHAGLRYDVESQDVDASNLTTQLTALPSPAAFPEGPIQAGIAQVNGLLLAQLDSSAFVGSTTYDAPIPSVGLTYVHNPNVSYGGQIRIGYRAGGTEQNVLGQISEYDRELLAAFELSVRSNWDDGRWSANGNVYYGVWFDQQVSVQQGTSIFDVLIENAGKSKMSGFEMDVLGELSPSVTVFGSLGYSRTEFTEFPSENGDFSGNRFARSPRWTGSAGATVHWGHGVDTHVNLSHTGSFYSDTANTLPIDGHTVLNAWIGLRHRSVSVRATARNLFDKTYLTTRLVGLDGRELGAVGAPRTFGIQLSADLP